MSPLVNLSGLGTRLPRSWSAWCCIPHCVLADADVPHGNSSSVMQCVLYWPLTAHTSDGTGRTWPALHVAMQAVV